MAKTADVQQAIWADPWFLPLKPDGKLLYLWAITTQHGNLAGLFVVAEPLILAETGLTQARLAKALEEVEGKVYYRPESGVIWVVARAKHVRSKTSQIATSIAKAVKDCPDGEIQRAFIERYGQWKWLEGPLGDVDLDSALSSENLEPQPNLGEVPSISHSLGSSKKNQSSRAKAPDPDSLPDDFDPRLAEAARRCLPTLQRTAEAKGAKPVSLLAVARAIETYPRKDHHVVAGEVEHWLIHGNGSRTQAKDVVARFRRFLDNSPDLLRPEAAKPGRRTDPALAKIIGRPA